MDQSAVKRNNVRVFGKGEKPIIFVHGFGCDQEMWRFVIPDFEEDYKVILLDLVGSGNSEIKAYNSEKYRGLGGHARDIIEICEELELKKSILVGHSVSSMIGVLAAVSRPDLFERLILLTPSPRYINEENYKGGFDKKDIDELVETLENNFLGWSSFITPIIIGNPEKEEFSNELKNSFCSMDPEIAKHFAKVTFLGDNRKDLKKVQAPTLVIQCNPDTIAPVEVGRYVQEMIPNSKYVELDSPGHCPHLTSPRLVINAIKMYLAN